MTTPGLELQKALYATLRGDAALAGLVAGEGIYDHVPATAPFPYITFGRSTVFDWSTSSDQGTEHVITVHVWSQAKGRKEVEDIISRVGQILADFQLVLPNLNLVLFCRELEETNFDADAFMHHGVMRFRALVEQTAV